MNKPLVSILMPNYNCEKYLDEAINSVLKQTYTNFEFIIIDDASTDNSWNIIKKHSKQDKRIKAFKNKKNRGIVFSRNKAFEKSSSKSKYYAIFDSDDISFQKRLQKQVEFLERNKDYGIIGSNLLIIDENSKKIGTRKYKNKFSVEDASMFIKSPLAQPSAMINKKFLKELRYSNEFEVAEDWDLWFRLLQRCKGANIATPLLKYRITSTQSKNYKLKRTIINSLKIRFKYMTFKNYFNIKIMTRIIAEIILLILPSCIVLWLFKKLEIKK